MIPTNPPRPSVRRVRGALPECEWSAAAIWVRLRVRAQRPLEG
ncbi:MAG: hypothetical protein ACYCTZ_03210 [Candidatus Dormibacteria bacterium]